MANRKPNPALDYARAVLSGEIVAGLMVRQAAQRHLDDLERAKEKGWVFDIDAGNRAIDFLELCHHTEGDLSREPCTCEESDEGFDECRRRLRLELWQKFYIASIFGWKRRNVRGRLVRRFKVSYLQVARKNGKTFKLAGIGLKLLLADDEPGAQIFSGATKEAQARIVLAQAANFLETSPDLRGQAELLGSFTKRQAIFDEATLSSFRPLGRDSKSEDGWNPHGALIDEYHAHPSDDLLEVLESGMGARSQPMVAIITTAGLTLDGNPCKELRDHGERVLRGEAEDDQTFFLIYERDADDDWDDEETWIKSNPNLGVSVFVEQLRGRIEQARALPGKAPKIRTKQLNEWVGAGAGWLNMESWDACGDLELSVADLQGERCFGAFDLSATKDLTAWALLFPPVDGFPYWRTLLHFYLPEEIIKSTYRRDRSVQEWAKRGRITLTQGNTVDYSAVRAQIVADASTYAIQEIGFDPWNAAETVTELQNEGLPLVSLRPTLQNLSPPAKHFEILVERQQLAHGNDPVLTWNVRNTAIWTDPNGNIRPDKDRSGSRIDGTVALIMAMGRALAADEDFSNYNDDESEGILVV